MMDQQQPYTTASQANQQAHPLKSPYPPVYQQQMYPPHDPVYPLQPPQVVYIQAPSTKVVHWDYLVVTVAAVLALVAYFLLPFVSALGLFSATGVQLSQLPGDVQGLWVPDVAASIAGAISGACVAIRPTHSWVRFITGAIIGLMGVVAIVPLYALYLNAVDKSSTAYLGTGFWLCGIANLVRVIGGIFVAAGE